MWRVCLSLCQGRVELQAFHALALNVQLDVGDNIWRIWATLVLHAPARRDSRAQQLPQLGCTLALPALAFLALHPAHQLPPPSDSAPLHILKFTTLQRRSNVTDEMPRFPLTNLLTIARSTPAAMAILTNGLESHLMACFKTSDGFRLLFMGFPFMLWFSQAPRAALVS
jgi:hypothetical protein